MKDRHTHRSVDVFDGGLEDVHAWFAAIVDSSNDPIISKNLNGVITTWNVAAQRLFGYPAEEAVGQLVTIIIPPELIGEEKEILRRLRAGECIEGHETRLTSDSTERASRAAYQSASPCVYIVCFKRLYRTQSSTAAPGGSRCRFAAHPIRSN